MIDTICMYKVYHKNTSCGIPVFMVYLTDFNQERYKMAYKVSDACVNCGACDSECSVGCISEKDGKRFIDPAQCVSCGACVSACPTEAIAEE